MLFEQEAQQNDVILRSPARVNRQQVLLISWFNLQIVRRSWKVLKLYKLNVGMFSVTHFIVLLYP